MLQKPEERAEADSRDRFEGWYRSRWEQPINKSEFGWATRRNEAGEYADNRIELAWQAWKASKYQTATRCMSLLWSG